MRVKNNACYNVTVRAGSFWTKESTKEKVYPKDGLTDWDFEALNKVWKADVKPLLDRKNPPPVPAPDAPPPAQAPTEDLPDAPW